MDHRTRPPIFRLLRLPGAVFQGTCPSGAALLGTAIAGALLAFPHPAAAQLVDNGAFRLFVDGVEVGREEFTIQRVGTGDAQRTFARGNVAMRDGRILRTVLQMVGPAMVLEAYQATLTGTDTAAVEFVRAGDRLQGTVVERERERLREYRADPTTVILEEGVAHHYFVLGPHTAAGTSARTLHAFAPLSDRPEATTGIQAAPHTLELDGMSIETTRVLFGAGDRAGAAWFDGSGRLVRVELFVRGFVAQRMR